MANTMPIDAPDARAALYGLPPGGEALAGAKETPEVPNVTHPQDPSERRLNRWENWVDVPLSLTAIPFLVAYAIPIVRPGVSQFVREVCDGVIVALWILYIIDYLVRLYLARNRRRFVRKNIIDLIAIGVPFLRPLRLLRLVALVGTFTRVGAHTMRGKLITYIAGFAILLVIVGSLGITEVERDAFGSNIRSFGDGLWFAFGAITDVEFADYEPVTTVGRILGMLLMLTGVAFVGSVTAVLASWLVEKMTDDSNPNSPATGGEIAKLEDQVTRLTEAIQQLQGGTPGAGTVDLTPTYGQGKDPDHGTPLPWVR